VVGVEMRIDGFDETKVELVQQPDVTADLLQHGIDDQRFAAAAAGKKIAVSARGSIEHLPENHANTSRQLNRTLHLAELLSLVGQLLRGTGTSRDQYSIKSI
jgi:hypothetical protein